MSEPDNAYMGEFTEQAFYNKIIVARCCHTLPHFTKSTKETPMNDIITKKCSECGEYKAKDSFYKSKYAKDGLRYQCKQCDKARAARWYSVPDNASHSVKRTLQWKKDNPEGNRKLALEYQNRNFDKVYKRIQSWQKEHPESRQVSKANRRAREKSSQGKITRAEWEELKEFYDYTCLCCRKREPKIKLTLDHVVPLAKGGENSISNAQPLCGSCNSKKNAKIIDYR
jgi:5-methylcytosine-specific restriction endonuclease McrA